MKQNNIKYLFFLGASALLFSCAKDLPAGEDFSQGEGGLLTVSVEDSGYASADSLSEDRSRATDTNYKTVFATGDAIGVYVVENGAISKSNIKLTKTADGWDGELRAKEEGNQKFFAYYPYDAAIADSKLTASASSAADFFKNYVSGITLPTDQGDQSKYTKADIMVGDGSISKSVITFGMKHQMALVVITLPSSAEVKTTYSLSTDASYTWTAVTSTTTNITNPQFTGFVPWNISGKTYRYLVKPGTSSLTGKITVDGSVKTYTINPSKVPASQYKTYNVSASVTSSSKQTHILQVGDFFMKDGSLVAKTASLTADQKKNCIGIVFQIDASRIGSAEKTALSGKGVSKPHGLVMALKNAGGSTQYYQWKTESTADNLTLCDSKKKCYDDISGLNNCNKVKGSNFSKHPAFKAASDYNSTVSAPSKTTGWYLPAFGQWWDILANLGNSTKAQSSSEKGSTASVGDWTWNYSESGGNTNTNIDNYLNKIGGSYVDLIGIDGYWSSSEYSATRARYVNFDSTYVLMYYSGKSYICLVRPVLAF